MSEEIHEYLVSNRLGNRLKRYSNLGFLFNCSDLLVSKIVSEIKLKKSP